MAKANSKRATVVRLTRRQYRAFAEDTKAVGMALNLSSFKRLNGWGQYSPWALLVCRDATSPERGNDERALISIVPAINVDCFLRAGARRPEIDWSVLEDHELYSYLVQHEIGHRQDNFDGIDLMLMNDVELRNQCSRYVGVVNEILADRYAWNKIRPGQPFQMTEYGKANEKRNAEAIAYLERNMKKRPQCKPEYRMQAGQYRDVPHYMLATSERAAYVGPEVNKDLLNDCIDYYRRYNESNRQPLY